MSWQELSRSWWHLTIGLPLGLERERSHTRESAAGSGSFALVSPGCGGYTGVRAWPPRRGPLVTGPAARFETGSATTASTACLTRTAAGVRAPLAGAHVATFAQLLTETGLVDREVLRRR